MGDHVCLYIIIKDSSLSEEKQQKAPKKAKGKLPGKKRPKTFQAGEDTSVTLPEKVNICPFMQPHTSNFDSIF